MPNRTERSSSSRNNNRSNSSSSSLSLSSNTSSSSSSSSSSRNVVVGCCGVVVATPGWREIEYESLSRGEYERVTRPHEREDTMSEEAYTRRHRLIELRERFNLLVYELKRERKRQQRATRTQQLGRDHENEDDELVEALRPLTSESASAQQLEEACAQLEQRIRATTQMSYLQNSSRRRKHYPAAATTSRDRNRNSNQIKLITNIQARYINNLSLAKLSECSFSAEEMRELAEETNSKETKRIKLDEKRRGDQQENNEPSKPTESSSCLRSPSLSVILASPAKEPQLKQIENIEKSTISLSQGKILRTSKQTSLDIIKPPSLDLLPATYCTFYRRIN